MTEALVEIKPVIVVCRRGHWIEGDPNGVMCPFCGAWENLPEPMCPNTDCRALLDGIVYRRQLNGEKTGLWAGGRSSK